MTWPIPGTHYYGNAQSPCHGFLATSFTCISILWCLFCVNHPFVSSARFEILGLKDDTGDFKPSNFYWKSMWNDS